jgi:hypothetical protein
MKHLQFVRWIARLSVVPPLFLLSAVLFSGFTTTQPLNAAQRVIRAPSNDNFSGALSLSFPSTVNVNDISQATIEPGEPVHGCRRGVAGTGSHSVWYKFTLNQPGTVTLSTVNSQLSPSPDTILSIYEGTSLAELDEVACNDDHFGVASASTLEAWLQPNSYVVKVSYWTTNPTLNGSSKLVLDSSFAATPQSPTPSQTPTSTPSDTIPTTPTHTPNSPLSTATPTPYSGIPTSSPTATKQGAGIDLIQNGNFELDQDGDKLPDGWTGIDLVKDKLACNTSGKLVAYQGMCAFRFKNKGEQANQLTQLIPVETLSKQQTLIFSSAVEVTQPVGKAIILKIIYAEPDAGLKGDGKDKIKLKLESITFGYSRLSRSFTLLGTPTKLEVKLVHKQVGTRLMLDALSLTRQP